MKKLLISLLAVFSTSVFANEAYEPSEEFKKTISNYLTDSFVQSFKYFKAEHGFIGIGVVTEQYKKMVFYTDENASFLMNGSFMDTKSGAFLSKKYENDLTLDLKELAKSWEDSDGFIQGEGENIAYVVIDANCGYCHKTYTKFQELLEKGDMNITVKWIPVGFLGQGSIEKGNILASAVDNEKGLELIASYMKRQAVDVNSTVSQAGKDKLAQNGLIMKKHGFNGVPLVVSNIEGKWLLSNGLPQENYFAMIKKSSAKQLISKVSKISDKVK